MIVYSVGKFFTGFAVAAFTAWKLTVNKAIDREPAPAIKNIHTLILIRYSKSFNHRCIKYQARGEAITSAMNTGFKKSFDNKVTIPVTDAPNTFLIPISFILCLAISVEREYSPRQLIMIAITVNHESNFDVLFSLS